MERSVFSQHCHSIYRTIQITLLLFEAYKLARTFDVTVHQFRNIYIYCSTHKLMYIIVLQDMNACVQSGMCGIGNACKCILYDRRIVL